MAGHYTGTMATMSRARRCTGPALPVGGFTAGSVAVSGLAGLPAASLVASLIASLVALGPAQAQERDLDASGEPPARSLTTPRPDSAPFALLVAFHGPVQPDAEVAAARSALIRFARDNAAAFLDLSPRLPPEPSAAAELARGIEAYRAFDHDVALSALSKGLDEAARTGAAGLSPSDLSDLHIYRGLVFAKQGDAARSWDDFAAAASLDPTRKLDPVRYAPRIIETFARATQAIRDAPFAQLVIASDPACALSLDGNRITPGEARTVPFGHHYVRVVCSDHLPYGARLLVQQPEQRFEPAVQRPPTPDDDALRALGRDRGSEAVLFARAMTAENTAPTVTVQWLDIATGQVEQRAIVSLAAGAAGPDTRRAAATALARNRAARTAAAAAAASPSDVVFRESPRPWYRKPWVWGVAGAVLTAAALTPFLLDSSDPTGFEVRPGGQTPAP